MLDIQHKTDMIHDKWVGGYNNFNIEQAEAELGQTQVKVRFRMERR